MSKSMILDKNILPQHAFFLMFVINNVNPTKREYFGIEYDFIEKQKYLERLSLSSYMVQRLFGFYADYIPKPVLKKMDDDNENR